MSERRYIKVNVVSVVVISFLVTLGFGAANLVVPYYILALKGVLTQLPERLEALHAERAVVEIGAMSSAFMATRAVFAAASGWLSDRFGRRPMIVVGMAMYTILGVLYAMTTSPWQLIALRAVQGVASALVWPVAEALLVDSVLPGLRTRALSVYVMTMNVGQVIGPVVGSLAYEVSKRLLAGSPVVTVFRAPFVIITITTLPGVVLALLIREVRGSPLASKAEEVLERFRGGLRELPKSVKRALISFYVSGLFNGLAAGIVSSIMIVYIIDFVAKDPTKVGMIMSVSGIAGLVVAYPAAHVADKLSEAMKKALLLTTYVVARILLGAVGFVRSLWTFILIASILNIAMNVSMPLLRAIQAGLIPSHLPDWGE
jgi:MFS family permease